MSVNENLMWHSSLPAGWGMLFERLVTSIAQEDDGAVIEEAKQKFGTMRLYLNRLTPATEALVDEASRQSAKTCERCGEPGELMVHPNHYYETLCVRHRGDAKRPDKNPIVASFRFYADGKLKLVDRS